MDNDELLKALQTEEDNATQYTHGDLAHEREAAYREYLRKPYGNEVDGMSQVVSSDVADAVEGMLPDLLDVFVASDKAVKFEPQNAEDEEAAEQATNACNYVFYKQNDGFLTLYTAVKDALLLKTGAIKWGWEEKQTPTFTTYTGVTEEQIAMYLAENPEAEILEKEERTEAVDDGMGGQVEQLVYDCKVKIVERKGKVKIEALPPEELIVSADHTSVLLEDCSYVAHVHQVTLSDIHDMGFTDVTAGELHDDEVVSTDRDFRQEEQYDYHENDRPDEEMKEGWLKEEYILFDQDGDGIAERLKVLRLGRNKILDIEEVSHVQIAAWTPYILTHRFHGLSVRDLVSDIQKMKTEIWRQTLDNLYISNNQQKAVLTDNQGNPQANIDDLLNPRAGGIIREQVAGAVRPLDQPWIGSQSIPMIEFLDQNKENRTGYTRYSQGLDSDALNQTARGVSLIMNASQKRIKLMARIIGECLLKPTFRGVFKTLTDNNMDKLSFRLNNDYVEYDPQEWRDGYDMSINVGLGTGDKEQNMMGFQQIMMLQEKLLSGGYNNLVKDDNIYNIAEKLTENLGFKNVAEFFTKPEENTEPALQRQIEQMKQQMQQMAKEYEELKADKSIDSQKVKVDEYNAKTNRLKVAREAPQIADIGIKQTNVVRLPTGEMVAETVSETGQIKRTTMVKTPTGYQAQTETDIQI